MHVANEVAYHQKVYTGEFSWVRRWRWIAIPFSFQHTDQTLMQWWWRPLVFKDTSLSYSLRRTVQTEVDPIHRQFTQWQSSLSRVNSVNGTYNELCRNQAGDHYVTSAVPPSAGKIIAWSTVWLALNEQMWATMSFSLGATTAWGGGRSWIWNNETVNGLHCCYWFYLALVYVLCPWSSTSFTATHPKKNTQMWTCRRCACIKRTDTGRRDDPFLPWWTLSLHLSFST